ncbi:disease resistance protein (TIR-NBS-LRR class), putative [Medicago truncatula]|uniref:Disease resistance protein (TIR-NBS-LRR class), putative n=1 Tax=Medicago truncatula TaxID=3880 RepID=A0A072V6W5_MEDTR|nr:disease resistance protein (TIR-NBS-LRR class), putative [Medicago truncatula]
MEQIVIPVFYKIDPLHMKKQTWSYKKTFEKHMRDLKNDNDKLQKLQKWKDALIDAASLDGWNSQNCRYESDFIMNIVEDVLQKLNLRWQYEIKGLVGVEKNYEQFEPILEIEQQMSNAFETTISLKKEIRSHQNSSKPLKSHMHRLTSSQKTTLPQNGA